LIILHFETESKMLEQKEEIKLKSPPSDGITNVTFGASNSQFLLVSSWDKTIRLYDVLSNTQPLSFKHDMAVLDCAFKEQENVISGGLDNCIRSFDLNTQQSKVIGTHEKPVKCVEFSKGNKVIVSGSWDGMVKLWDDRVSRLCISTCNQPDKVYSLSVVEDILVVGTACRKVLVWDLRNMAGPQQKRESSLKFQTRCVRCSPDKLGYVVSSIEGRVAVDYLDISEESQARKYAFKCHRLKENGIEKIYPVNSISFHKDYKTFASGGSDGFVNIWDGANKKRLCQFRRYPTSIASLDFSDDGRVLAIASSYMYENDDQPENIPIDNIFIRNITDKETKPK